MPTANTFETPRAEPALLRLGAIATGLAASAYAAGAGIADSPYWNELGHRPIVAALSTAASMVDWSGGGKFVVVAGASLAVMIDSGRRLFAHRQPPRPTPAHASRAFSLEGAR